MSSPRIMSILELAVSHDPRGARMAIHKLAKATTPAQTDEARDGLRTFLQGGHKETLGELLTSAAAFVPSDVPLLERDAIVRGQIPKHPLSYSPAVGDAFQGKSDRAPVRTNRIAHAMANDCIALIEERLRTGTFESVITDLGIRGRDIQPDEIPAGIRRRSDNDVATILMGRNARLVRRPHAAVVQLTDSAGSYRRLPLHNSREAEALYAQRHLDTVRESLPLDHPLRLMPVSVRVKGSLSSSERNEAALRRSIARRETRRKVASMALLA